MFAHKGLLIALGVLFSSASRSLASDGTEERTGSFGTHNWAAKPVSILSLIVSPERSFDTQIQVAGFLVIDFETSFLCYSPDVIPLVLTANCIDLELDLDTLQTTRVVLEGFSARGAIVEGLFQAPIPLRESSTITHEGEQVRLIEVPIKSISGRLSNVRRVLVPAQDYISESPSNSAGGDPP